MPAAIPVQDRMRSLQMYLRNTGRYLAPVDGIYGPATRQAILTAMEDGPDTYLSELNYREAAARLGVRPSYIMAFAEVEANGSGFEAGRPKILFEPHRFSRLTQHRFDASNPTVSYRNWKRGAYPKRTDERYAQLLEAVGLDPWAGFQACSYGKFQILGENFQLCGFDTPWAFAVSQAYDEIRQLNAFETFIRKRNILPALKLGLWETVADEYNGTASEKNHYAERLEDAADKWARKIA